MRAGTSFVTTAPAPTNASSPISNPGRRTAPPPMRAPRRIVGPLIRSRRRSVRPMKLSFVVTTQGAMKTSSSSSEYAVIYASAWIFVRAPTVVSFSISEPRPRTTSSPTCTRSRTQDWSPRITRAPMRLPAKTIAPVETIVPSPISVGGSGSRFAVERGESDGCLPTTAYSSTLTPSPSRVPGWTTAVGWISAMERPRQAVECPHDAGSVLRHLAAVAVSVAGDQTQELLALQLQRLVRGDLRHVDVPGARLPLAVRVGPLPRRL